MVCCCRAFKAPSISSNAFFTDTNSFAVFSAVCRTGNWMEEGLQLLPNRKFHFTFHYITPADSLILHTRGLEPFVSRILYIEKRHAVATVALAN